MIPLVSVVLSVYNGASQLAETIDSILGQSMSDFELVVVDDGSTDATPSILESYSRREARLRVITQPNAGLTRALIRGCDAARAALISRQDCGDISRPDRLARMMELLRKQPSCVVGAGECEYVGPGRELLYVTDHAAKDLRRALLSASVDRIVSLPHHATAVMRADAYRRAGGYRPEFYFAQDLDLWIRMAALGEIVVDSAVVYEARLGLSAISSAYRPEQIASATIAVGLRDARTDPERAALLREVALIRPPRRPPPAAGVEAGSHYFIASCLKRRHDPRWRGYARKAVCLDPFQARYWLLLLKSVIG